jgi:hypothetical protein
VLAYNTILLVIATLQVAITGKVRLLIYCVLPCGMRFRSLADFVGNIARRMPGMLSDSGTFVKYVSLSFESKTV